MFEPLLDVLPEAQRELWPTLVALPDSYVLYGGTALALRLGHRSSVDFDFFSSETLDFEALYEIPFISDAEVLQREPAALTISVHRSETGEGFVLRKYRFWPSGESGSDR